MEQITGKKILQELGAIAFARATDLIAVRDGSLVVTDTEKLTEDQARAIASVEKTSSALKVKFYDKLKALELLGKAVGLFDGGAEPQEDNGLLEAILAAIAQEEWINEIQNLQQQAAAGNDMVEPSRP